ncbi:MAG: oxygenase MpaB family protein [Acidimicrobiia bacterium]
MASIPAPLDDLRRSMAADVRRLLAPRPLPAGWFERSPEDPGLFEPGSPVWRVHAARSGLIGGLRALLLQTMHPLAMAGVADHSDYRHDPWGRLHRTGAFIAATTYGSTSAAEAAIARVRAIHDRVTGVAPDGRPYRANDPHLLAWVHATEVDSFLRAYRRYGPGDLDAADEDGYVAGMAGIAERLGVIDPPRSRDELRAVLIGFRPELRAGAQAREAVRFLLWPPLPAYLRPAYGLMSTAAVGMLPGFVRRELRLPTAPLADPLVVRPAVRATLSALGWTLGSEPPAVQLASAAEERAAQRTAEQRTAEQPAAAEDGGAPEADQVTAAGSPRPSARRSRPASPGRTGRSSTPAPRSAPTTRGAARSARSTSAPNRQARPGKPSPAPSGPGRAAAASAGSNRRDRSARPPTDPTATPAPAGRAGRSARRPG